MWREIPKIFDQLSLDPAVRVVVLASSVRAFTGGLDRQYGHVLNNFSISDTCLMVLLRCSKGYRSLLRKG